VYASTTQPLVSVEVVDTGAHTVAWDDLEAAADSPIYDLLVVVSRFEEAPPDTLQLAPGSVVRVHSPSEVITVNLEDPS